MIKLNNLEKYFFKNKRNEIHVINDINLDLPESGLVVLLGPSGSGKTTLLNVIGGLDKTESGEIIFEDQVMKGYNANKWDDIRNEKVGYIFQNYNLLPSMTVFENVAFVLRLLGIYDEEKIENSVHYILKAVGMYKYRKKKATQLSGGQQQRVAIARALVKNPDVVIADEPTGNLDSKNTFDIMKIIKEISKNKLVVLVTHEKDIASIYGDRIIELKDGQIISDESNESQLNYDHKDENVVYLKDMHQIVDEQGEKVSITAYDESNVEIDPIKVKFIIRNKTLYIDVDSSFKKVKLIEDNSNLIIKDEHFKKMDESDYTETTFDADYLNYRDVDRHNKMFVSFGQILKLAAQKVIQSTFKGKLLLLGFIVSGVMIALATGLAANFFVPKAYNMRYDNHYVYVTNDPELNVFTMPSYDELNESLGEDDFINFSTEQTFQVVDQQNDSVFFTFNGFIEKSSLLRNQRVKDGEFATEDNEIMISSALADSFFTSPLFGFGNRLAQEFGIWDYDDLYHEKIKHNGEVYTITGIIRSDLALIYTSDHTYMDMLAFNQGIIYDNDDYQVYYGYDYYETSDLSYGALPQNEDQVLVSTALLETLGLDNLLDDATVFPVTIAPIGDVSGVVEDERPFIYLKDEFLERIYASRLSSYYVSLYIHTDDPRTLIDNIKADTDFIGMRESTYAITQSLSTSFITFMIPMVIIIFAASFVGFYFLMHSTMISRIYETSVYRSLGMKKRELFMSYIVESAFISTISSVVGYLVCSYFLFRAANSPLGFSMFIVNGFTLLIGLLMVYAINIFAGMIPITTLLRKTPSEISSKYDI